MIKRIGRLLIAPRVAGARLRIRGLVKVSLTKLVWCRHRGQGCN